jgi:hypothetical protein
MGDTFAYISKFWLIVHDIFGPSYEDYVESSVPEAEEAYQKLLAWSDNLPSNAIRAESCPHHVLIMQCVIYDSGLDRVRYLMANSIWYHAAILEVWRPFLPAGRQARLNTFTSMDNWPVAAYGASVRQLKRLVYLYRQRFEATNLTMLITPGLLSLVNVVFHDKVSPEAQFYFVLAAGGCLAMAPWCPGLCGVTKAFFSLGWRIGIFNSSGWMGGLVEPLQNAVAKLTEDVTYSSLYPINLDSASQDIETLNMEELANEFETLAVSTDENPHGQATDSNVWRGDPRDLTLTLSEVTKSGSKH